VGHFCSVVYKEWNKWRREKMKDNEIGEIKGNSSLKKWGYSGVDIMDGIYRRQRKEGKSLGRSGD